MDNRRLIIAVVACIVIILGWQTFAQYMGWLPEPTPPQPAAEQAAPAPEQKAPAPAPVVPMAKFVPSEGREVRVDTPLYTAVFHSGGGVLQSFTLKNYKASILPDSPDLNMVTPAAATVAPMGLLINGQPSWNMGQWSFDGSDINLENGDATLAFQGEMNGIRILREITFHASTYLMDEKVTLTSANSTATRMSYNLGATNFSSENQYDVMSMAWNLKGSLDRDTDVEDLAKEGVVASGDIYWAGAMSNYFLSAVIPERGQNTSFKGRITEGDVWRAAVELSDITLSAGQPTTLNASWWIGPKSRDLLAAAPNNLKSSIDMGIFSFVAVPLLVLLTWFQSFVGNWGIAIILLTILIKIAFWPLSRKSFKSMEQMKKLQPMMKQLQEKYKDNKEALSREMMQLYKTYGVNPMGGCLPILIQLPVFVALYQALLNCIELRHASFITYLPGTDLLWLADLSVKDPFYITPLVMGATMFLQQWLSPAMGDPQQRKIMLIMPVVFTVMFINFPSGLVVYWLCNNILSILQQAWTLRKTK